ncbi:sensor histidine kinase [Kutzneria viridogrisea]|uniref:Oxygen sensor histidine kinase NreB n=2 Tax=Kutzneria TaxID=43356 RepID=W5WJ64_9PSEU|nr:sensor histidine kinase [Kutzneria albida]AHI00781.1 hypothetical protein KALB_7423 [Kutzneria albida DSM 43870]MBA8926057.1 signal transduction histidine kinase [Kutzneria viridogrisea]
MRTSSFALVLLRRSLHVLFFVLLAVGVRSVPTAVCAAVLLAWYLVGVLLARRTRQRAVAVWWLLVLTAGWVGLVLLSADFVWVAFALMLLHLQMLPMRLAVTAMVGLTAVAAFVGGQRGFAGVLGPVIGAGIATVMTIVYKGLRDESEANAALTAELAVAAERERMAREIHDTVAQGLSSIVLLLQSANAGEHLDTALGTARDSLEQARRVVRAMTPAELDGRPLADALRRLATAQRAEFLVDGDPVPLATQVEVTLLRVAQGGLANVRAHAAADRVRVTLTYQPGAVSLDVVDDGRGFDPARPPGSAPTSGTGVGLSAMRARLAEVGGQLVVESAPGGGTALGARIPT